MMKRKAVGMLWVLVLLLGAACSQEYGMSTSSSGTTDETDDSSTVNSKDFESTVTAAMAANCASHEAATDYVWQAAEAIPITLNDNAITVGGNGDIDSHIFSTIPTAGTSRVSCRASAVLPPA